MIIIRNEGLTYFEIILKCQVILCILQSSTYSVLLFVLTSVLGKV